MSGLVDALRDRTPEMLDSLARIVSVESPSADTGATASCADEVSALVDKRLGFVAERVIRDGHTHLRWRFGGPVRVLLVGHLDTVWPLGTVLRWPFEVRGETATGPGVFDMKAGIVQGVFALEQLDSLEGVGLLITSDEEVGSATSKDLIEETARGALAALVLEPSAGGALKTARKGVAGYVLEFTGRAAHAGLEPEKGANALTALAHAVLGLDAIARPDVGTTVTPTVASAGTTENTVPGRAVLHVDVRVPTPEEHLRVESMLRDMRSKVPGTTLAVAQAKQRAPMPPSASRELFERARRCAERLGIEPLRGVAVGGGSDGNITAGAGVPTLDGLGAVGDGAHAEGEHILVGGMGERAALVAALVADVLGRG